jgi:hypothetical protein
MFSLCLRRCLLQGTKVAQNLTNCEYCMIKALTVLVFFLYLSKNIYVFPLVTRK